MDVLTVENLEQTKQHELSTMGSFQHSYLQSRLAITLDRYEQYMPLTELTLDMSDAPFEQLGIKPRSTMEPDVSLYPLHEIEPWVDHVRMREMPLLAIEIVSPWQGIHDVHQKFGAYFSLGIRSCWMVVPSLQNISVFSDSSTSKQFTEGDVVDEVLGIRLPLRDIFYNFRP